MIRSTSLAPVWVIVLTAVIAGCGPTGAGSPSPSPSASPTPVATPSPDDATPSPAAATPQSTQSGVFLRSTDPNLEVRVPDDWFVLGPAGYREQVEAVLAQIENPDLRRSIQWELDTIAAGKLRDIAVHSRGPVIALLVLPEAATLDEAVEARRAELAANAPPYTIVSEGATTDLFVPAHRTEVRSDVAEGVPSQTIEFLGHLADGRVVVLNGTAPLSFEGFPNLMLEVARSLRAT